MRGRDFAHDRQAKAGSIRAASDERLEQMVTDFGGRSRTFVANRNDEVLVIMSRGDYDGCPRRRRLDGIENEVVERAPHLIRVEARLLVLGLAFERDRLRPGEFEVRC